MALCSKNLLPNKSFAFSAFQKECLAWFSHWFIKPDKVIKLSPNHLNPASLVMSGDLLPQPNDILPGNSPGPSHFIGRDLLRPQPSINGLGIDSEMLSQFIHRVIILFHRLPLPHPRISPSSSPEGPFYSVRINDLTCVHIQAFTF